MKKNSPFDPNVQVNDLNSKIVVSLEKVSEVFRVMLWNSAKNHGLTPIQLQVLLFLKFHAAQKRKVAVLALEFELTKATMSETVKSLLNKGLITKTSDPSDQRSQFLNLTEKGLEKTTEISEFSKDLENSVAEMGNKEKETLFSGLFQLLGRLSTHGFIPIQSMCFTCKFYDGDKKNHHHCSFLNTKLSSKDLRVDCADHSMV